MLAKPHKVVGKQVIAMTYVEGALAHLSHQTVVAVAQDIRYTCTQLVAGYVVPVF